MPNDQVTSPDAFTPTERSRAKRLHHRAHYDKATVHRLLDRNPMCHVGYTIDGQPYVTPTMQWREGERVYWHGSSASRMLRQVKTGIPVCLTASRFTGFVLARSGMHSSINYEAVMLFGTAHMVEDPDEKQASLKAMMDFLFPGRWEEIRGIHGQELKATTVVGMDIEEASAKVRTGGPIDDEEDYDTVRSWNGELPLVMSWGEPVPDPRNLDGVPLPDYLANPKIMGL